MSERTGQLAAFFFILWLFFVLATFFAVQKPFSAANARAVGNLLLDLLTAAWLGGLALGLGSWFLDRFFSLPLSKAGASSENNPHPPTPSPNLGEGESRSEGGQAEGRFAASIFSFSVLSRQGPSLSLETFVLGTALGLGALGLFSFALGLLGLLSPIVAYGVTLALTAITLPRLIRFFQQWRHRQPASLPAPLITAYCLLILLLTLLVALLPPTDWDGLFYHLTGPKLYLRAGHILDNIDIPHFNFPSLMEMLYAWMMLLRGDIAAKLLHFLFALLLAGLVYLTAQRFLSKKSGWLAVVILLSMPMVSTLAGWAYNDLALAFYQLAAIYSIIKYQLTINNEQLSMNNIQSPTPNPHSPTPNPHSPTSNPQSPPPPPQPPLSIPHSPLPIPCSPTPWLILSGIFAGLAMGLKYTSFITPLLIAGLILWFAVRNKQYAIRPGLRDLVLFGLSAALVASPWYLKNWLFTGNPVYPFLFDLFGGQFWDSFRADWYAAAGTGIGFRPATWLSLPWLLTLGFRDANYWDGRTGPLLLLFLPLILVYRFFYYRRRDLGRPAALDPLLVYVLAQFLFWTLGVIWSRDLWQSRLLLSGLVALAPVAGWVWADLPRLNLPYLSISRFVNLAVGLTLALTVIDVGLLTLKIDPLPYLVGLESREAYLTRRLGAHYGTMEQINKELPPEAVIAFLWEPRSYYCRHDCRPDSILDEFPHLVYRYKTAQGIAQAWRKGGVTHVLIYRTGLNFVLHNEEAKPTDLPVLHRLENQHLRLLFDVAGSYQVYTLEGEK